VCLAYASGYHRRKLKNTKALEKAVGNPTTHHFSAAPRGKAAFDSGRTFSLAIRHNRNFRLSSRVQTGRIPLLPAEIGLRFSVGN